MSSYCLRLVFLGAIFQHSLADQAIGQQLYGAKLVKEYENYGNVALFRFRLPSLVTQARWYITKAVDHPENCAELAMQVAVEAGSLPIINPYNSSFPKNTRLPKSSALTFGIPKGKSSLILESSRLRPGDWFIIVYREKGNSKIKQAGLSKSCHYFTQAVLLYERLTYVESLSSAGSKRVLLDLDSNTTVFKFLAEESTGTLTFTVTECSAWSGSKSHGTHCPIQIFAQPSILPDDKSQSVLCPQMTANSSGECSLQVSPALRNTWYYLNITKIGGDPLLVVDLNITLDVTACQEDVMYTMEISDFSRDGSEGSNIPPPSPLETTTGVFSSTLLSETLDLDSLVEGALVIEELSLPDSTSTPDGNSFGVSNTVDATVNDLNGVSYAIDSTNTGVGSNATVTIDTGVNASTTADTGNNTSDATSIGVSNTSDTPTTPTSSPSPTTSQTTSRTTVTPVDDIDPCPDVDVLSVNFGSGSVSKEFFSTRNNMSDMLYTVRNGVPFTAAFDLGIDDLGGVLILQSNIVDNAPQDRNVTSVMCLQQDAPPLWNGVSLNCQDNLLFRGEVSSSKVAVFHYPFPGEGRWYVGLYATCTQMNSTNRAVSSPVPCPVNLSLEVVVEMSACIDGCGENGKCETHNQDGVQFHTCNCKNDYIGWGCTDDSQVSRSDFLLKVLLLTLSNAIFLFDALLCLYLRHFPEAISFLATCFFSTMYHACDSSPVCITDYDTLQFCDFFASFMSILLILIAMARLPPSLKSLLHIIGAYVLAFFAQWDRFSLWSIAVPLGAGILTLVISWIHKMYKRKKLYPSPRRWLFCIVPGTLLAVAGLSVNAAFETDNNYQWIHSAWHVCMGLGVLFLVPPRENSSKNGYHPMSELVDINALNTGLIDSNEPGY